MTKILPADDLSPLRLRAAFSQFGTGVTVVTAQTEFGPIGMTANSFSSVSLDPPLVLWCPANNSKRASAFAHARHFAIHVLSADQGNVARAFAQTADPFANRLFELSSAGVPLLPGCLATFECCRHSAHEGGDHTIVVGRVERIAQNTGKPLLFYGGNYGGFKGMVE